MKSQLYNLRPYSWIDLFLIGFVAKFSVTKNIFFELKDIYMVIGLFFLWCFFNLILELRHGYEYRAKTSLAFLVLSALVPIAIAIYLHYYALLFALLSMLLILVYLLKNKDKLFGNLSMLIRGLIQASYFFYALMFYSTTIKLIHLAISIVIIVMYSARASIGDIRDVKNNKVTNKKTFVVNYGLLLSMILIEILLLVCILIILNYTNILVSLPLLLFCLILFFYRNGYVLHQLMIMTTSFVSINLIAFFIGYNLIFMNLIYTGLLLNMVFYPLLERKSNLEFK